MCIFDDVDDGDVCCDVGDVCDGCDVCVSDDEV